MTATPRPANTLSFEQSVDTSFGQSVDTSYLKTLFFLLWFYAILGRLGAHIGVPLGGGVGIYPGNVLLLVGILLVLFTAEYTYFFHSPVALIWVLFIIWNSAQTLPYISQYGLVALRDGALWGYSFFAFIVASIILAHPKNFVTFFNFYRPFARIYPLLIPFLFVLSYLAQNDIIGQDYGIYVKSTEVLAHAIGAFAFVALGFAAVPWYWRWVICLDVCLYGVQGRGGLLGFAMGAIMLAVAIPRTIKQYVLLGSIFAMIIIFAVVANVRFQTDFAARTFSTDQLMLNITSIFEQTRDPLVNDTREWRLDWWGRIINYTFYGPYFFAGKGYGINLADDDGFQTFDPNEEYQLRSPHNSHLTFLARSGVPGLALWIALQVSWFWMVFRTLLFMRHTGRRAGEGILGFVLTYWAAYLAAAATDVALEGPLVGIWFWVIFGVGMAMSQLLRRHPDLLDPVQPIT
jgi:hypothetical protein